MKVWITIFIFAIALACSNDKSDSRGENKNPDTDDKTKNPTVKIGIGDFNKDGKLNKTDVEIFAMIYGHYPQGCGSDSDCDGNPDNLSSTDWQVKFKSMIFKAGDINKDGVIDMKDLLLYQENPDSINKDIDR